MKGWVVYDSEGAKRNAWFVEKLLTELRSLGLSVEKKIFNCPMPTTVFPDFAIVRTMNTQISEWLDGNGVRVFNNPMTAKIACDKWQTYLFCKQNEIPVLEARLIEGDLPPFDFPFVVKSRDGHGGSEVYLCGEKASWDSLLSKIDRERFIAQPLCDEVGKDMRVYMLGGKVLAAMLRSSHTDFRSNFSLGGRATKAKVDDSQKRILAKVNALISPDFCGVDFIRHKGEWILNEIEDPVGTRMLYEHTDIDAAQAYVRHIYDKLVNN